MLACGGVVSIGRAARSSGYYCCTASPRWTGSRRTAEEEEEQEGEEEEAPRWTGSRRTADGGLDAGVSTRICWGRSVTEGDSALTAQPQAGAMCRLACMVFSKVELDPPSVFSLARRS